MSDELDIETFDVLDAVKNVTYPEDDCKLYMDQGAAARLIEAQSIINSTLDNDVAADLEKEAQKAYQELQATSLTFHLRGLSRGLITAVNKRVEAKYDKEDWERYTNAETVAQSIMYVKSGDGKVDKRNWTAEDVERLADKLTTAQWTKILQKCSELTFSNIRDEDLRTDPDFS